MSDMGDMHRDMRDMRRMDKAEADKARFADAEAILHDFQKLTAYHWRTTIGGYIFDYWPTTGAYRWSGNTKHADAAIIRKKVDRLRWEIERTASDV